MRLIQSLERRAVPSLQCLKVLLQPPKRKQQLCASIEVEILLIIVSLKLRYNKVRISAPAEKEDHQPTGSAY